MKKILEYLPLLSICLVFFGFSNLYFYYAEFRVDIYNYISNTEILLSFFPTLVLSSIVLYSIVYQSIIELANKKAPANEKAQQPKQKNSEPVSKNKKIFISAPIIVLFYILISILINLLLTKVFHYKPYDLQLFNLFMAFTFLIFLYYLIAFKNEEIITDNLILVSVFLVLFFSVQISTYRKLDALKLKDGIEIKNISFQYNAHPIKTSKTFLFIGQTQSSLFLYNKLDSTTVVLNMSKIDSLVIK